MYYDLLERIFVEISADFESLAAFCALSKACATAARKSLYRELDLIEGAYHFTSTSAVAGLSLYARHKRRETMRANQHLWDVIDTVTISLDEITETHLNYNCFEDMLPWVNTVQIAHLNLQFGKQDQHGEWKGHFKVNGTARQAMESILSSSRLVSFDLVLLTAYDPPNHVFPGWIFRHLNRKDLKKFKVYFGYATRSCIIPGAIHALSPLPVNEEPKLPLEEFDIGGTVLSKTEDTIERCTMVLSGLCFNFNFSRLKKLTIRYGLFFRDDDTFWKLPNLAAGTLEDLTIIRYPNIHPHTLQIKNGHFARYHSLKRLTIDIVFNIAGTRSHSCQSLVDLFRADVPLPSTLESVTFLVRLGVYLSGNFPEIAEPNAQKYLAGWRQIDEVLGSTTHPSLHSVHLHYEWSTKPLEPSSRESPTREGCGLSNESDAASEPELPQEVERRRWSEGKAARLHEAWKDVFSRTCRGGLLHLSRRHSPYVENDRGYTWGFRSS